MSILLYRSNAKRNPHQCNWGIVLLKSGKIQRASINQRTCAYYLGIHKSPLSLKCDCTNFWDGNEYFEREYHFQDWRNAWQLWFCHCYQGKSRDQVIAIPVKWTKEQTWDQNMRLTISCQAAKSFALDNCPSSRLSFFRKHVSLKFPDVSGYTKYVGASCRCEQGCTN